MQTPTIGHYEFTPAKQQSGGAFWVYVGSAAGAVVAAAIVSLFDGDRSVGDVIRTAFWTAVPLIVPWLLMELGTFGFEEEHRLLRIGPQGIRDWAKHRKYIPWHRVTYVEPQTTNPEAFADFAILIDGPNAYSKSALARFFDNAVARPLGGQTRFTISFENLDADKLEVAALVQRIVAAAKA